MAASIELLANLGNTTGPARMLGPVRMLRHYHSRADVQPTAAFVAPPGTNEKHAAKNLENAKTILSIVKYLLENCFLTIKQQVKLNAMLGDKHFDKVAKLLSHKQLTELATAKQYLVEAASDQHREAPLATRANVEAVTSAHAPAPSSSPVVSSECFDSHTLTIMIAEAEKNLKDLIERRAKALVNEAEAAEVAEEEAVAAAKFKAEKEARAVARAARAVKPVTGTASD